MTLCTTAKRLEVSVRVANPGGRTSPTDIATTAVAAVLVVQRRSSFIFVGRRLFIRRLCEFGFGFCRGPVLCKLRKPSFNKLCEFGFCHGAVHCDFRRPKFTNSFCGCCHVDTGYALRSGPRRPSFTRARCGFCRDTGHFESRRPSFTNTFFGWCSGGVGRVSRSRPRRPNFTRRYCEFDGLLHVALGNALPEVDLDRLKVLLLLHREEAQCVIEKTNKQTCWKQKQEREIPLSLFPSLSLFTVISLFRSLFSFTTPSVLCQ